MKFGINTFLWSATFNESDFYLLPRIKDAGFDGAEIPLLRPVEFAANRIRREAAACELELTACTVLVDGLSLISDEAGVRQQTRTHLRTLIETAATAGIHMIAGPLYSPVGYLPGRRRTRDEWLWAVEGFQSLGDTLTDCNVTLAIEPLNRFETYFLNTAADAALLAEQVGHSHIGILFDTFHANIEEKHVAAGYQTVGRHLKHVHTCENDRGAPGSGHVAWQQVFASLAGLGYDGWLTIEGFGFALPGLSAAAAIWRDIEADPEVIATDGLKFLKQSLREQR